MIATKAIEQNPVSDHMKLNFIVSLSPGNRPIIKAFADCRLDDIEERGNIKIPGRNQAVVADVVNFGITIGALRIV